MRHVVANYLPTYFRRTGGTDSARYCYSVWLRHLVHARRHNARGDFKVVAELGPGDSLGIGLAALLSGAAEYRAFDVVRFAANQGRNLAIFDELVELFRSRTPIPGDAELPNVFPRLTDYCFPHDILSQAALDAALEARRVAAIRESLATVTEPRASAYISYVAPWNQVEEKARGTVDFVFSQAVMEHVTDPAHAYQSIFQWLRPGGFMSHQVDFRSHDFTRAWNGHWACSSLRWRLITGFTPYLLNRASYSLHRELIEKTGFTLLYAESHKDRSGIQRHQLAREFQHLSDDDLYTFAGFFQAVKN